MVKGKRPNKEPHKESHGAQQSSKESHGAQQSSEEIGGVQLLPPRKKKEKPSSAQGALPVTPSHPPPVKNAPHSSGTSLTILKRSPHNDDPKQQNNKEKEETSSQSSQEAELDASLVKKKGKKKKGQATLATSPTKNNSEDEKEDTLGSDCSLPALGSSEEHSPTTSTDFLAEFLGDEKDEDLSPVPDDYSTFLKKTGEIKALLYKWECAKEFPEFKAVDVSDEEIDLYIERVLKDSHKWKDTEGVNKTLQDIDLEDKIVRGNDRYLRMVYLRLGKAVHLHAGIAKAHAASMKEAAFTWQQRAIKLIEDATCNVQIDNKQSIKEIQNESQRVANDLKKQLDELTKKYSNLQTEYSFACAALAMKEEIQVGQDTNASTHKVTQLTLELGEQRKNNEDLRKQLQELCANFTAYRAGQLKNSIEIDIKGKRDGDSIRNNAGSDRISTSPTWGKTRKDVTPSSSDFDSKGDSSTSQSDHGWGQPPARRNKDRRRTPPRDDRRIERQRSPPKSKFSNRDVHVRKRPASPSKEVQSAKRTMTRDAWIAGGKEAISQWSGVDQFRRTIRSFGLSDTKNMITRVKEADTDLRELFYQSSVLYHHRANEEHSKYLPLHKELGIPGIDDEKRRPVSFNFYYAKALKLCYDHQNTLRMKAATDNAVMGIYEETIEHNKKEPNPYEHYDDSYIISNSVSSLGEHTRERMDHKKASYRLWLQEKDMLDYHKMRYDFFNKAFLQRDMQHLGPMVGLLDKEDVMEINEDMRNQKQMLGREIVKPTVLFKEIYAKVYKEHYQEIIEQIETYATYGTPIEKFLNCNDIDTVFYIDTGANTQGEF